MPGAGGSGDTPCFTGTGSQCDKGCGEARGALPAAPHDHACEAGKAAPHHPCTPHTFYIVSTRGGDLGGEAEQRSSSILQPGLATELIKSHQREWRGMGTGQVIPYYLGLWIFVYKNSKKDHFRSLPGLKMTGPGSQQHEAALAKLARNYEGLITRNDGCQRRDFRSWPRGGFCAVVETKRAPPPPPSPPPGQDWSSVTLQ